MTSDLKQIFLVREAASGLRSHVLVMSMDQCSVQYFLQQLLFLQQRLRSNKFHGTT